MTNCNNAKIKIKAKLAEGNQTCVFKNILTSTKSQEWFLSHFRMLCPIYLIRLIKLFLNYILNICL